jgi:hypothetical protein
MHGAKGGVMDRRKRYNIDLWCGEFDTLLNLVAAFRFLLRLPAVSWSRK